MTKESQPQGRSQRGFRPPADEQQTAFHSRKGQLPADILVSSVIDPTGVEAIAAELQEVRQPKNAEQLVAATLDAVDQLLGHHTVVHNDRAYAIAIRLSERLQQYLVRDASTTTPRDTTSATHPPSLFAQELFNTHNSTRAELQALRNDFIIEIQQLIREFTDAIEAGAQASQATNDSSGESLINGLRVGRVNQVDAALATSFHMDTATLFAQLPELVDVQAESQRQIQLHNPLAPHYTEYWRTRAQATAIVRGIERPQPSDLPQLAEMLAVRGSVATEVIERSRDATIEDTAETAALRDAYSVLADFINQATEALEAIEGPEQNQSLARQLASFNLLRMEPEQAIAVLNAAEAVKQHNPELLFRLLGVSTRASDGTATESDLFGNPLMITLDQTSRDLATRRSVSPGIAVLRDRIDTLLTVDQHRRPLPFLNEQQIRAAESALQQAVSGDGADKKAPNIIALTMLMQYTPVVELGKLMREAGFERRAEYVDRIRRGMPREILADLMDMPEELLEDPEVLAAWRERYDLDHPDLLHRYAMRYVLDVEWYHDASTNGFLSIHKYVSNSLKHGDHNPAIAPLPYTELTISNEKLAKILKFRKMILQETRAAIVQDRGLRGRLFGVTTDSILETFIQDPSVGADDSLQPIPRTRKDEYIANTHAFILGLWSHAPKEQLAEPSAMMQMVEDLKQAVDTATINTWIYDPKNHYTFGPLQFALSVLPQEDCMRDQDWSGLQMPVSPVILPSPVIDALATNEFLRPGRVFTHLIGSRGSEAISMLEVLRTEPLTDTDSSSSGIDTHHLRRTYPLLIPVGEGMNTVQLSKVSRFVDDPQLLTPVERELNQEMEEIMIDQMVQYVLHVIVDQYKKILAKQPENFTEETTLPTNIFHQFLEILKQDPNRNRLFRNALRKYCGEGGVVAYVNRERLKTASDSDDEFLNRVNEYIQDFESYMIDKL